MAPFVLAMESVALFRGFLGFGYRHLGFDHFAAGFERFDISCQFIMHLAHLDGIFMSRGV